MFQSPLPSQLNLPITAFGQPNSALTESYNPLDSVNLESAQRSNWKMTFDDEFDGLNVDAEKWHTSATNRDRQGTVYLYRDRFKAYLDDRNVHLFNGRLLVDSQPAILDTSEYHVYAVLWEPDKVINLIDGKVVNVTTNHVPDKAMYINLATEINEGDSFYGDVTKGRSVSQEYDYVRVWSHS